MHCAFAVLARAVFVGLCTAGMAAALFAHLLCAGLLKLVLTHPWLCTTWSGYLVIWHALSDADWRVQPPEEAEE